MSLFTELLLAESLPGSMQTLWPLLAECLLKSVAVLGVAGLIAVALRRTSAALKHVIWLVAVLTLAALPVLSITLPGWALLPGWEQAAEQPSPPVVAEEGDTSAGPPPQRVREAAPSAGEPAGVGMAGALSDEAAGAPMPAAEELSSVGQAVSAEPAPAVSPAAPSLPWPRLLVLAWAGGTTLLLLGMVLGMVAVAVLGRRAQPMDDERVLEMLDRLRTRLSVRRRVRLLEGSPGAMPMTWAGAPGTSAKILLPPEAKQWSDARLEAVLLHELAHVKRRDCLTQALACLVACFYWPNPLVWVALWRLRLERERACDDLVLAAGQRASDYAEQLLEVAVSLRPSVLGAGAAIAMARRSSMEGRVLAVLDQTRSRRALSRTAVALAAALLAAVAVPLAMVEAGGNEVKDDSMQTHHAIQQSAAGAKAQLPTGDLVELVAIGRPSPEGLGWWTPAGSVVEKPDWQVLNLTSQQMHSIVDQRDPRKEPYLFVARVGGQGEPPAIVSFNVGDSVGADGGFSLATGESGGRASDWTGLVEGFLPEIQTTSLRLYVASGVYQRPKANDTAHFSRHAMAGRSPAGTFNVSQVHERNGNAAVTVAMEMVDEAYQRRVRARDHEGKWHTAKTIEGQSAGALLQEVQVFNELAPDDIEELVFEYRPAQSVEFRNVSLKPGHEADVEVKILPVQASTTPDEATSERPFVYVMGEVSRPGAYVLPEDGLTLLQLMASTGGTLTDQEQASELVVDLVRQEADGEETLRRGIALDEVLRGEGPTIRLQPGDVLVVRRLKEASTSSESGGELAFGPVNEQVLHDIDAAAQERLDALLDLDTGTVHQVPIELGEGRALFQWMNEHGVDLAVDQTMGGVLIGRELELVKLPAKAWETVRPADLSITLDARDAGVPVEEQFGLQGYLLKDELQPPLVFAFRTAEGSVGLLQLSGDADGTGVRFRYKLVQQPPAASQPKATSFRERLLRERVALAERRVDQLDQLVAEHRAPTRELEEARLAVLEANAELEEYLTAADEAEVNPEPAQAEPGSPTALVAPVKARFAAAYEALIEQDDSEAARSVLERMAPELERFEAAVKSTGAEAFAAPAIRQVREIQRALSEGRVDKAKAMIRGLNEAGAEIERAIRERAAQPEGDVGGVSYSLVAEHVLSEAAETALLDLDTGRTMGPIARGTPSDHPAMDLYFNVRANSDGGTVPILSAQLEKAVAVRDGVWEDTSAAAVFEHIGRAVKPSPERSQTLAHPKDELPATYVFQTHHGGRGVLQVTGFTDDLEGIQIRYKLVQKRIPATQPAEQNQPALDIDVPANVLAWILGEHLKHYRTAQAKGLPANTQVHSIDEDFTHYSGGLLTYVNHADQPVEGPVHLSNFGRERPDFLLVDEWGQRQTFELRERPYAEIGRWGLWWKPDEPIPPGSVRVFGYISKKSKALPGAGDTRLMMINNHFGSPVLESFFVVVPNALQMAGASAEPTSTTPIGAYTVYLWQEEVPADTTHRLNVRFERRDDHEQQAEQTGAAERAPGSHNR